MTKEKASSPEKLSIANRISFLLKDTVMYGGAIAFSRVFSLITFPLLARNLLVSEYGYVDLILVFLAFIVTLVIFGQDSAVARLFYENDDQKARSDLITQSLVLQCTVCLVVVVGLLIATPLFYQWVDEEIVPPYAVYMGVAQVPFAVAINFSQNILKWTFQRRQFLIVSLGFPAGQAAALLAISAFSELNIESVLAAYLAVNIVFGTVGVILVRAWLTWPKEWSLTAALVKFAIPLGVIGLIGGAAPFMERNSIQYLLGEEQLGLYAAGSRLAALLALLIGSFQTAWGPFSTSIYRQTDAVSTFNLVLKVFTLCACLMVLAIDGWSTQLLTVLASERYVGASVVVFPLALALAVQAVGWITEVGIGLGKKPVYFLYSYSLFICTFVPMAWLLAPHLGITGVALAVLLSYSLRALASSWLAQKAFWYNWEYGATIVMLMMTAACGFLAHVDPLNWGGITKIIAYACGSVCLVSYCIVSIHTSHRDITNAGLALVARLWSSPGWRR